MLIFTEEENLCVSTKHPETEKNLLFSVCATYWRQFTKFTILFPSRIFRTHKNTARPGQEDIHKNRTIFSLSSPFVTFPLALLISRGKSNKSDYIHKTFLLRERTFAGPQIRTSTLCLNVSFPRGWKYYKWVRGQMKHRRQAF